MGGSDKRVEMLVRHVNEAMGAAEQTGDELSRSDLYVYVQRETVIGLLTTLPAEEGRLVGPEPQMSQSAVVSIRCQVSRIWVSQQHRRTGVALQLLRSIRRCGHRSSVQCTDACATPARQVGFSHPTAMGRALASRFHASLADNKIIIVLYVRSKDNKQRWHL